MIRFFLAITLFSDLSFTGQPMAPVPGPADDHDITVSYSITMRSKKANTGIWETYNGGVQTFFAHDQQARLRLVSLMRIQSIFLSADKDQVRKVIIIKESGSKKYRSNLTAEEWKAYNKKYDGHTSRITGDTAHILGHICKKAIVVLKDGREITAWYTPSIQRPICSLLEPAFSLIPGLVLKYEYTYRRKTITYTATSISFHPINANVFTVPASSAR
jgi:GLPGLI family protein